MPSSITIVPTAVLGKLAGLNCPFVCMGVSALCLSSVSLSVSTSMRESSPGGSVFTDASVCIVAVGLGKLKGLNLFLVVLSKPMLRHVSAVADASMSASII